MQFILSNYFYLFYNKIVISKKKNIINQLINNFSNKNIRDINLQIVQTLS